MDLFSVHQYVTLQRTMIQLPVMSFIDMIVEKGCRYALYFHYMPVGNDASLELLPNPKQRLYIKDRVREIRNMTSGKGIFTMDFQNDGEFVGGCIAGGRNYFHINANGDAEPMYIYPLLRSQHPYTQHA